MSSRIPIQGSGKVWLGTAKQCQASAKFVRQTFHEFAALSIRYSDWAAAFYRLLRHRGKRHHAAVRALAFKWIRILFRCWKNRTPYNEATHLASLSKRKAPVLQFLES